MPKPELVLSNTTSFFLGGIPALFKNAQKFGFKYVEIIPYRWTRTEQISKFVNLTGIHIAGIHLAQWWNRTFWQELRKPASVLEKIFILIWEIYLGGAAKSPAWQIAQNPGQTKPYVLLHSDIIPEMGWHALKQISSQFRVVIENIPYHSRHPRFFWDLLEINAELKKHDISAGLAFDIGHFQETLKSLPNLDLTKIYELAKPTILHISYNGSFIHTLPNRKEQQELKNLLKLHSPQFITLETNPLISIKKGKELLEKIIKETLN